MKNNAIIITLMAITFFINITFAEVMRETSKDSTQQEILALVGGRLIDGYGGQPLENSVILIKRNSIYSIGQVDNCRSLPMPR